MRRALRTLKGYTGRVMRDLRRHLSGIPAGALREDICDALVLTGRLPPIMTAPISTGAAQDGASLIRPRM